MPNSTSPEAASQMPFAGLGPDLVLDALDAVGLRGDGRLIQLNSYENRVFQVFLEDGSVVVTKFYRPERWSDAQILEEHAYAQELADREIPVANPWALSLDRSSGHAAKVSLNGPTLAQITAGSHTYRFGVTTRLAGRAPELEDTGTLEWIGRFIGRLHAVGAVKPFDFRETLSVETFGTRERDWLLSHGTIPPEVEAEWQRVSGEALAAVAEAFNSCGKPSTLRLHGDCHLGNILWTASGPHFVDLDDAVMGPAAQDLWMLLSGDHSAMTRQLAAVLDGYKRFMDFDRRSLRLVEPLRTLRIIRHSAWIARRWNDPAFPAAFPWFESPSYWSEQTTLLRGQLDAMAKPPLGGLS